MAVTRTAMLMRRDAVRSMRRSERGNPGQGNLAIQALYAPSLRSHVHRPGPAFARSEAFQHDDPATEILAAPKHKGRAIRTFRAILLLSGVPILSPVAPGLII